MGKRLENISNATREWIGSVTSLVVHTLLFGGAFLLVLFGFSAKDILIVVTYVVSLEAIYLAIFIQMSVNIQGKKLYSVAKEVEDVAKDMADIQENVEDIQENVEELQEDVEELQEDETEDEDDKVLERIEVTTNQLMKEVMELKKLQGSKKK